MTVAPTLAPTIRWFRALKVVGAATLVAIAVLTVSSFLRSPTDEMQMVTVAGDSMAPTILDGARVTVEVGQTPEPFDVVVYRNPADTKRNFVGRVVGMPGERLELRQGALLINGKRVAEPRLSAESQVDVRPVLLGSAEYYVLGDNRVSSLDSRSFGPVSGDLILGVVQD